MEKDYVLYLRVGDRVYHKKHTRWGMGIVVEERRSELPGGFCYVRVDFQDGKVRIFDNNFRSASCCYYAGIEKIDVEEEDLARKLRQKLKKQKKREKPPLKLKK